MSVERIRKAGGVGRRGASRAVGLLSIALTVLAVAGACSARSGEPLNTQGFSDRREARAEYRRLKTAVKEEPGSAQAWRDLGDHCYSHYRTEEAVRAWRESLRLEPQQARLLWSIGTVYHGQGDDEAAQREYEAALAIDPDHTGSLTNLGVLYRRQGRLDEAERLLERATEREGTSFWQLGQVYADQGRFEKAVEAFERSLDQDSSVGIGLALLSSELGEAQMKLGRDADAIQSFKKSLYAFESAEEFPGVRVDYWRPALVAYRLAVLTARAGELEQSLDYLRQALGRDSDLREQASTEPDLEPVRRLPEAAVLQLPSKAGA